MNEKIVGQCNLLIRNRDKIKQIFRWESGLMNLACAAIYTLQDCEVNTYKLEECYKLLKENTGILSNFKGYGKAAVVSLLALSERPKLLLQQSLDIYEGLKKEFWTSAYLPLASIMIAKFGKEEKYTYIIERAKKIYKLMKKEHPFITSEEDVVNCCLLSLIERPDKELITDMEMCYNILTSRFSGFNALQALSHTLTIAGGDIKKNCEETIEIYDRLKDRGYKYGNYYELPVLGLLAISMENEEQFINDLGEIEQWLARQKGFGFFGGIAKKQRLMYAVMIAQQDGITEDIMSSTAVNTTISLLIAQQVAVTSAVAASVAASAAVNS